jgi:hypothetical protein
MFAKRTAVFVCAIISTGAGILLASQWDADYFRQVTARHAKRIDLVSASGRGLSGFFDGMRPDPRWDARRASQASRQIRGCGSRGGLAARLFSLFERTAYAQGSCSATSCNGHFNESEGYDCPPRVWRI